MAWIDKNVQRNKTENLAKAYLNYLYSPRAQEIITQFNYRVNDKAVMAKKQINFQRLHYLPLKMCLVIGTK